MGIGKTILVIAIIIGAIYFLSPNTYDNGKGFLQGVWNSDIAQNGIDKAKDRLNEPTTTQNDTIAPPEQIPVTPPATPDPEPETPEEEPEEEPISYEDDTTNQDDLCLWNNAGLPDYVGTSKEGQTCADTILDPDWECIANPPTGYSGMINIVEKTSSPLIRCCLEDGNCRWNT